MVDETSNDTNETVAQPVSPIEESHAQRTPPLDTEHHEDESWRQMVGRGMDSISTVMNENIVAARYATFASIALLSAYGIANTPLFFRFKTVKGIPSSYFLKRRTIRGRLVRVIETVDTPTSGDAEKPIICLVRQLSPVGRLLSRSAFEFAMKSHPVDTINDDRHELLRIEIAAVQEPPPYLVPGYTEQPGEWLRRLTDQKTPVSCQLLARRARREGVPKRNTKSLAEFSETVGEEQTAICHMRYRPGGHFLTKDVAESLVRHGRATLLSSLFVSIDNWMILDTSDRIQDLKNDTKYISRLEKAEYEAATEEAGMWADLNVRDSRKDLVDEIAFQAEANIFKKGWRWFRG